jgi:trehalose 6-phosphate synthase
VRLIEAHHAPETVTRYLRAADLCYVGSLHDGMNLVCKEFVRARDDEQGILVLSAYAGAAQELSDALMVNPHNPDSVARALVTALAMTPLEQRTRMRRMRQQVASATAADWARAVLSDVDAAAGRPASPAWRFSLGELPALVTRRRLAASDASAS